MPARGELPGAAAAAVVSAALAARERRQRSAHSLLFRAVTVPSGAIRCALRISAKRHGSAGGGGHAAGRTPPVASTRNASLPPAFKGAIKSPAGEIVNWPTLS